MNCEAVRQESIVEAYLRGKLDEAGREAFELHYFECERCFAEVEAARSVQAALRQMPRGPVAIPRGRGKKKPRALSARQVWIPAIAAAALIAGVAAVVQFTRPRPAPVPTVATNTAAPPKTVASLYAELARFDPPPYSRAVLRGAQEAGKADFAHAMDSYIEKDWPACRAALSGVVGQYPKLVAARYYLGICSLLSGHAPEGEDALRQVIGDGDTAYLEEAHFYLAKALLAGANAEEAKAELRKTIAMGGDLEPQASALAARIP